MHSTRRRRPRRMNVPPACRTHFAQLQRRLCVRGNRPRPVSRFFSTTRSHSAASSCESGAGACERAEDDPFPAAALVRTLCRSTPSSCRRRWRDITTCIHAHGAHPIRASTAKRTCLAQRQASPVSLEDVRGKDRHHLRPRALRSHGRSAQAKRGAWTSCGTMAEDTKAGSRSVRAPSAFAASERTAWAPQHRRPLQPAQLSGRHASPGPSAGTWSWPRVR